MAFLTLGVQGSGFSFQNDLFLTSDCSTDLRSTMNSFSLLISPHCLSESTVFNFNYSDSFVLTTTMIYKYT